MENMDTMVRFVCAVLILVIGVVLYDSVKLLIESNQGKKNTKPPKKRVMMPRINIGRLVKEEDFFAMTNHGPDLCELEEHIVNIPYYKDRDYLLVSGECDDKN